MDESRSRSPPRRHAACAGRTSTRWSIGGTTGVRFVFALTGAPAVVATTIHHQGTAGVSTRVPGLALSGPAGIEGRSIVLHAGESGSLEASPGIPNNRVACGGITTVPSFF